MAGDGAGSQGQGGTADEAAREPEPQAAQEPLTSEGADATGVEYEALLAERDAKIAELEGASAEAGKSAQAAEAPRGERG